MQKPALGRFISRSRLSPQRAAAETGRSSEPLSKGSNRNQSFWLAAGGSAARGGGRRSNSCRASPSIAGVSGAAGPRGGEGRAGLGCSAAPHPSRLPAQVSGCLVLYLIAAKGPKNVFKSMQNRRRWRWERNGRCLLWPWPGCFVHGGRQRPGASAPSY